MQLVKIKEISLDLGIALKVLACEFVQAVFLEGLYRQTESQTLYFHGGTSLRLLHQGYRFSEDLDFTGDSLAPQQVLALFKKAKNYSEKALTQLWGPLEVELKIAGAGFPVIKAWLNVQHPQERGKFKVKLEAGSYPVHRRELLSLSSPHLELFVKPLIVTQSLAETLADKVNALAQRSFIKGRDFFDVWFLLKILKVEPDFSLIRQKWQDYRTERPLERLREIVEQMPSLNIGGDLDRFLPNPYRERLQPEGYSALKESTALLLKQVLERDDVL